MERCHWLIEKRPFRVSYAWVCEETDRHAGLATINHDACDCMPFEDNDKKPLFVWDAQSRECNGIFWHLKIFAFKKEFTDMWWRNDLC